MVNKKSLLLVVLCSGLSNVYADIDFSPVTLDAKTRLEREQNATAQYLVQTKNEDLYGEMLAEIEESSRTPDFSSISESITQLVSVTTLSEEILDGLKTDIDSKDIKHASKLLNNTSSASTITLENYYLLCRVFRSFSRETRFVPIFESARRLWDIPDGYSTDNVIETMQLLGQTIYEALYNSLKRE